MTNIFSSRPSDATAVARLNLKGLHRDSRWTDDQQYAGLLAYLGYPLIRCVIDKSRGKNGMAVWEFRIPELDWIDLCAEQSLPVAVSDIRAYMRGFSTAQSVIYRARENSGVWIDNSYISSDNVDSWQGGLVSTVRENV